MSTIIVKREEFSEEDWLNAMYRKSESSRTRDVASTSLRTFDLFCKNQGLQRDEMIEKSDQFATPVTIIKYYEDQKEDEELVLIKETVIVGFDEKKLEAALKE